MKHAKRWLMTTIPLLAGVFAACGDSGETKTETVVRTVTVAPATVAAAAPQPETEQPDDDSCDARGVTTAARNEGTCTDEDGQRVKVVDRRTKLTLPEMNVAYDGYSSDEVITASTGAAKASGTFITLNLRVTNKLNGPVAFDPEGQVLLVLDGKTYTPDFDAMNTPGKSFLWNRDDIQAGNSKAGTVTFDVPKKRVAGMEKTGNILLYQFSDSDAEYGEQQRTLGFIRTYK